MDKAATDKIKKLQSLCAEIIVDCNRQLAEAVEQAKRRDAADGKRD